jgi:hypothetical protein
VNRLRAKPWGKTNLWNALQQPAAFPINHTDHRGSSVHAALGALNASRKLSISAEQNFQSRLSGAGTGSLFTLSCASFALALTDTVERTFSDHPAPGIRNTVKPLAEPEKSDIKRAAFV